MDVKLIKVGNLQPNNQLHSFSQRKNIECVLEGDPSGWILTVTDLELVSSAVKYQGWGLLEPEKVQCPMIPNCDGHDSPSDFLFERSDLAKRYLSKQTEATKEKLSRFTRKKAKDDPNNPPAAD